jgi:hypothetical protein
MTKAEISTMSAGENILYLLLALNLIAGLWLVCGILTTELDHHRETPRPR